jgi:hypothetical protein
MDQLISFMMLAMNVMPSARRAYTAPISSPTTMTCGSNANTERLYGVFCTSAVFISGG